MGKFSNFQNVMHYDNIGPATSRNVMHSENFHPGAEPGAPKAPIGLTWGKFQNLPKCDSLRQYWARSLPKCDALRKYWARDMSRIAPWGGEASPSNAKRESIYIYIKVNVAQKMFGHFQMA